MRTVGRERRGRGRNGEGVEKREGKRQRQGGELADEGLGLSQFGDKFSSGTLIEYWWWW